MSKQASIVVFKHRWVPTALQLEENMSRIANLIKKEY
jgi:hypothetical protein